MASTQNAYSGPGWNDCQPDVFAQRLRAKTSRTFKRVYPHQTKTTTQIVSVSEISPVSSVESELECADEVSSQTVLDKLTRLFEQPTQLPAREISQYTERLTKAVPSLDQVHLAAIDQAMNYVLDGERNADKIAAAREVLVHHSLIHNGITAWLLPLRRTVERLQL